MRNDLITGKSAGSGIAKLLREQRELFDDIGRPQSPEPVIQTIGTTDTQSVVLPWCPSVNHYWGQRVILAAGKPDSRLRCPCCRAPLNGYVSPYLTTRAKDFRASVARAVAEAGLQKVLGRVAVEIAVNQPDNRERDLDNLGKAPLDALTHCGVWESDSQIDRLTYDRGHVVRGGRLTVTIGRHNGSVST